MLSPSVHSSSMMGLECTHTTVIDVLPVWSLFHSQSLGEFPIPALVIAEARADRPLPHPPPPPPPPFWRPLLILAQAKGKLGSAHEPLHESRLLAQSSSIPVLVASNSNNSQACQLKLGSCFLNGNPHMIVTTVVAHTIHKHHSGGCSQYT